MLRVVAISLALVLLCLPACRREAGDGTAPPTHPELTARLDSLRRDYARGDLPAALHRARRLRAETDTLPPGAAPTQRAELYQHLAQLHFHRSVFLDSIKFYARRAQDLLPATAAAPLRARQYLCEGYAVYHDFNWLDMAMLAQLGQQTLVPRTAADSLLFAELLLGEARAAKQYGRDLREPALRTAWMDHAEARIDSSAGYLRDDRPTWRAYRHEQLVYHLFNASGREAEIRALLAETARPPLNQQEIFALPDRLYGAFYHRLGRQDSLLHHYARIADRRDLYAGSALAEANFVLDRAYVERGDHARSLELNRAYANLRFCCPPDTDLSAPDALLGCDRIANCTHIIAREGEIYRDWAAHSADPAHLRKALLFAESALNGFQASFADYDEHAVLSKNLTVGSRLLTTALQTALPEDSTTVSRRRKELLFRSMELGSALLLTRDLTLLGTPDSAGAPLADRADVLRRDLLRKAFSERMALPRSDLHAYRELRNRQSAFTDTYLSGEAATATIHRATDRGATLAEVQRSLSPREALLEFTESEGRLLALYVDPDTTVAYGLPLAEVLPCRDELLELLQGDARTPVAEYAAPARTLYAQLLGPVTEFAAGRAEWIVSPAAALNDLPLAALLTAAPPPDAGWADLPYLLGRHEIRYVPSYRADRLLQPKRRPLAPGPATAGVWTHPDLQFYLGDVATKLLDHLPGNHFLGADNHATYVAHSPGYDLLHLSVHAGGNPRQLHENYLHLSARHRLNGLTVGRQQLAARLVVLAACSTARGFTNQREGTYSLRRSFHQAGVPDVVASVYDIPAAATAQLLEAFYHHLLVMRCSPARALAHAQREMVANRQQWPGAWAGLIVG